MDPFTAFSLAGTIVQFVDFGGKIVVTALKIYRSPSGATQDGLDAEKVADSMSTLKSKIESGLSQSSTTTDRQLLDLGGQCVKIADGIVKVFRSPDMSQIPSARRAIKQSLRLAWKKEDIETLKDRLASFREQLELHILVDLRREMMELRLMQSEKYAALDVRTKEFMILLAEQRKVFDHNMEVHLCELKKLYIHTQKTIQDEHRETRNAFVAESKANAGVNVIEHEETRLQIRSSFDSTDAFLSQKLEKLRIDIQHMSEELMRVPRRQAAPYAFNEDIKALDVVWHAKYIELTELMTKFSSEQVDKLRALSGSQICPTPLVEPVMAPALRDQADANNSVTVSVLGSNVLPYGRVFKVDGTLLREGGHKLGFESQLSSLPTSLKIALSNRFSRQQISDWRQEMTLAMSSVVPFFFAGSFIFPSTVRLKTNGTSLHALAALMTPAKVFGYHTFAVEDAVWPALYPCQASQGSASRQDSASGMLSFGLRDSQRQSIFDFQNGMFDLKFEMVEVELAEGAGTFELKAGCFVWSGDPSHLLPLSEAKWSPTRFMQTSFYEHLAGGFHDEEAVLSDHVLYISTEPSIGDEGPKEHHLPPAKMYPRFRPMPSSETKYLNYVENRKRREMRRRRKEQTGAHKIYATHSLDIWTTDCDDYIGRADSSTYCAGFPDIYPHPRTNKASTSDLASSELASKSDYA